MKDMASVQDFRVLYVVKLNIILPENLSLTLRHTISLTQRLSLGHRGLLVLLSCSLCI